MKLKLFKVVVWNCYENTEDGDATSTLYVIADTGADAKKLVEEGFWTIGGMEVKSIEEVNVESPQVLCIAYEED